MEYVFHDAARQEFLDSAAYYESKVPGLGERFIVEINRCIELLLDTPEIGTPISEKLRRHVIDDSFPFAVVYAVIGNLLFIVAVAHNSRRPNYWKKRFSIMDR
jgi:toxin ParE1/3/4